MITDDSSLKEGIFYVTVCSTTGGFNGTVKLVPP